MTRKIKIGALALMAFAFGAQATDGPNYVDNLQRNLLSKREIGVAIKQQMLVNGERSVLRDAMRAQQTNTMPMVDFDGAPKPKLKPPIVTVAQTFGKIPGSIGAGSGGLPDLGGQSPEPPTTHCPAGQGRWCAQ